MWQISLSFPSKVQGSWTQTSASYRPVCEMTAINWSVGPNGSGTAPLNRSFLVLIQEGNQEMRRSMRQRLVWQLDPQLFVRLNNASIKAPLGRQRGSRIWNHLSDCVNDCCWVWRRRRSVSVAYLWRRAPLCCRKLTSFTELTTFISTKGNSGAWREGAAPPSDGTVWDGFKNMWPSESDLHQDLHWGRWF